MTNAQAISPSLDIIRSNLKAWKPAAKSSQAALQQITAAKQRQPRQSHQSSQSLHLPSLHRRPDLPRESHTSPTASMRLHQLTQVCLHHLIPKTDGTRSHGCGAGISASRVIFGPTEGAWVGVWVCRRRGDEWMCVVGRVYKQAAVCLHRGLLQLREQSCTEGFQGVPTIQVSPAELTPASKSLGTSGKSSLLGWGSPTRKAPHPSSPYWENWGQTGSSHPSWDCGTSPAGEKTQKPHILKKLLSQRAILASFLCPPSLLSRGHQAGHWPLEERCCCTQGPVLPQPGCSIISPSPWGLSPSVQSSYKTQ